VKSAGLVYADDSIRSTISYVPDDLVGERHRVVGAVELLSGTPIDCRDRLSERGQRGCGIGRFLAPGTATE
jgi:hypothetical protein